VRTLPIAERAAGRQDSEAHWFAAYTRPRFEKVIHNGLIERGFQSFLPLILSRSDAIPLFTGYVFVRSGLMERSRTLDVPGLLYLVSDGTAPLSIPDVEIESLRIALASREVEPCGFMARGTPVVVIAGPLSGMRGRVIRSRPTRVFVSIDLLSRSVMVEMHPAMIQIERLVRHGGLPGPSGRLSPPGRVVAG
jgi:hypothetical protein